MKTPLILAIDQGGQSTRVGLYDLSGELLFSASVNCATRQLDLNQVQHIEQNTTELLDGFGSLFDRIASFLEGSIYSIIAAGYSGQGSSLICWDRLAGTALSPVISWQDIRGNSLLQQRLQTEVGLAEKIIALTGLRASPHYGASKYRWCLENLDAVIKAKDSGHLMMGPIFCFFLQHFIHRDDSNSTPVVLVDPGHAQRTLLWDKSNNQWSKDLLDSFGIQQSWLPQLTTHYHHYGDLSLSVGKAPLMVAARDQGASLFAGGEPDPRAAYVNVGTGAFIQRVSNFTSAPDGILVSPIWLEENQERNIYAWEATVNGAAAAMPYVRLHTGIDLHPAEIDAALSINVEKPCWFLNAQGELSAPWWITGLSSQWSAELNAQEKVLAWLESIQFQIRLNIRLMNAEFACERIICSGGFSQSDVFCQHLADVCQLVVERADDPEASLRGIAYMAAGRPSGWSTQMRASKRFVPKDSADIELRFQLWLEKLSEWIK